MAIKYDLKDGVYLIDESSTHHTYGGRSSQLDEQTIHLLDDVKQGLFEQLYQIDNMSNEELAHKYKLFDDKELDLFYALEQCSIALK